MLITFSLLALLAVVAIVFAVSRSRTPAPDESVSAEPPVNKPAAPNWADALMDEPHKVAAPEVFNPEATVLHMQPWRASDSAPRKRAAVGLPPNAHLHGLSGCHKGKDFPIVATGTTVGRNPSCHVVLGDARVSAHHAWIGMSHDKLILRDLKSTNGTFLNAQTQTSVTEVELCVGDTIFFGGHQGDQFRFMAG